MNLQAALEANKSRVERNRLGQFATPPRLAREILRHARELLPSGSSVRFLDPAFGTGAFFTAFLEAFPARRVAQAVGFEIDADHIAAARIWKDFPLIPHNLDFTNVPPPSSDSEKFDLIVCNPPYVRYHHISAPDKLRLKRLTASVCREPLSGLAGLYCHFLLAAHAWMKAGGLAGWLVPSEFMDVNYGRTVKKYLLENVTLLRIHRFDPNDLQFEDALVSSCLVWFRNAPPPERHDIMFSLGGTLAVPRLLGNVSAETLRNEKKWTGFPASKPSGSIEGPTLANFFDIKRGLATGGNDFFILNREQIETRRLPRQCFRPILPSPRHLPVDVVEADETGMPLLNEPLFLLDCRLPETEMKHRFPTLWDYLEEGGRAGIAEGYLCRRRNPWYAQEPRPPSPFLCTYIGRSDNQLRRPFRFILNRSQATAANTYLILYPKPFMAKAIAENPDLAARIWKCLTEISDRILLAAGRVYGGGMHKIEPSELAEVPAGGLQDLVRIETGSTLSLFPEFP